MEIQQLIKQDSNNGGYKNIFPHTYVQAIKDKLTDKGLDEILASFNMLYLPYVGSKENTRLQVPRFLRRRGLWITYVDYEDKINTEWYNSNLVEDYCWGSDQHWEICPTMSGILQDYFNSNTFKQILIQAVSNAIGNILTEEEVRKICEEILSEVDLGDTIQNATNEYFQSEEFNQLLQQSIDNSVNNYIEETLSTEKLAELVQQYLATIDFNQMVYDNINQWVENNNDTLIQILEPTIDDKLAELIAQLRQDLQEWCNNTERVIANALARHEQDLILLKEQP